MAMHTLTKSPTQKGTHDCPCGCAPCEETCCSLDCLEQPNFFCGQLLTDQDLKALVQWTKGRLGLSRFRHGWGVVCGLHVRCDPERCGSIYVGPGYAISCCGDDIIVCKDERIDLSRYCTEIEDPCAGRTPVEKMPNNDRWVTVGGCRARESELRLVDISVRYSEVPSAPQSAIGRSVCKQVRECEFGRIKEGYEITPLPVFGSAHPGEVRAEGFANGYNSCLDVLTQFNAQFQPGTWEKKPPRVADIQGWLLEWIRRHPLSTFCCLHDRICDLRLPSEPRGPKDEQIEMIAEERNIERARSEMEPLGNPKRQTAHLWAEVAEILFWIIQDCRNAYLACACFSCKEDAGAPIARVWLRAGKDPNGQPCCSVVAIDNHPPFRRNIAPECWPAPRGRLNAGQLIWHDTDEASAFLARHGVTVTWQPFPRPASPTGFPEWYVKKATLTDGGLYLPVGKSPAPPVTGYYYADSWDPKYSGGRRVVGFAVGAAAAFPNEMDRPISSAFAETGMDEITDKESAEKERAARETLAKENTAKEAAAKEAAAVKEAAAKATVDRDAVATEAVAKDIAESNVAEREIAVRLTAAEKRAAAKAEKEAAEKEAAEKEAARVRDAAGTNVEGPTG